MEKGFKEPWQILLAQLHPVAFFGVDIFKYVFEALLKEPVFFVPPKFEHFSFVAIDEIQFLVESAPVYYLPDSVNLRPFSLRWCTTPR